MDVNDRITSATQYHMIQSTIYPHDMHPTIQNAAVKRLPFHSVSDQ